MSDGQENNKFLGSERVGKLLLKFSIPCILSLLISSLYNIVDQIFIGNSDLGYLGNAATGVVYPITIITMAFAWCFGDGAAAYLSLCQGRGDNSNSDKGIGNSIVIVFIISILFLILGYLFRDNLLYLFGASKSSIGLARDYFNIILSVIPLYMVQNAMSSVIRADGSPKFSMLATGVGAIINIILDPVFIFIFDMGIKGAAYATIIGEIVSFIVSVIYYTRTKTFKITLNSFKLDFKVIKNVIKLGVSTFITQICIVIISLVCNIQLAKYGEISKYGQDIPIAVIGIVMKVFSIVINIIIGIIIGAQPILGYNYGAKNYDRVKKTFKCVLITSIIVGIISTLVFLLVPNVIIRIFGSNDKLYMEFAVKTFRLFLMLVTFTCLIKVSSIFFQAVGEPVKATIVSLIRDIVFFIPLVIIIPKYIGINGVLISAPIADMAGMLVTTVLMIRFFRNMKEINGNESIDDLQKSKEGIIITISREHGSQGKAIGEIVANKLNIPYYYKEMVGLAAKTSGLDKEFVSNINRDKDVLHELYLTSEPVKQAILAQEKAIKMIAEKGECVIVGRASDYVLKDYKNVVKVFIYAPKEYRINKVMEMYGDSKEEAIKNINKSDKNRSKYYEMISLKKWKSISNYDICINSSIGKEETANIIIDYVNNINRNKK